LNNDNINVKTITMKHIPKKEFNRFYTIMKNNPGKSVLEIHNLYKKENEQIEKDMLNTAIALEANNLMPKELITNKIK
jgi:hypothetical protein